MVQKTVTFTKSGIQKLPNDKPVTYTIQTPTGRENYIGVAKRGRVPDRLSEHLPGGKDAVPGAKVKIEQHATIKDALLKETRMIMRKQPSYNKKGK